MPKNARLIRNLDWFMFFLAFLLFIGWRKANPNTGRVRNDTEFG
jgi:hypothetical protein